MIKTIKMYNKYICSMTCMIVSPCLDLDLLVMKWPGDPLFKFQYVFYNHIVQNEHNRSANYTQYILQMCHPCLIAPNMAKVRDKGAEISDQPDHF